MHTCLVGYAWSKECCSRRPAGTRLQMHTHNEVTQRQQAAAPQGSFPP